MTFPHYGNDIVNSYIISVNDHPTTATYICINNASVAVMKSQEATSSCPVHETARLRSAYNHCLLLFREHTREMVPDTITCNHSHMQLSVATCYCWIA